MAVSTPNKPITLMSAAEQASTVVELTDWTNVESAHREYWQQQFGKPSERWEDFEPAYRFTWNMRSNAFYTGRSWAEVEHDFQSAWELLHPSLNWERYVSIVHDAWDHWSAPTHRP